MEIPPLEEDTLTHILKSQWPSTFSMYKGTIKKFFEDACLVHILRSVPNINYMKAL